MSTLRISKFQINPTKITNGTTKVTISYECEISDQAQNPVTINLYALSSLNVTFDKASWLQNLQPGFNQLSQDLYIKAKNINNPEAIKLEIDVTDSQNNTDNDFTSLIIQP